MASSALFVGGPADGQLQAFPEAEPPRAVTLLTIDWDTPSLDLDAEVKFHEITYIRRTNPIADGAPWIYILADQNPGGSDAH